MKSPIAATVFVAVALAAAGALAACPAPVAKTHSVKTARKASNCVDLNAVPQIASQVVAGEPLTAVAKTPGYEPPTPTRYEGPTIGLTKPEPGVRPAPTVGYHWNLQ